MCWEHRRMFGTSAADVSDAREFVHDMLYFKLGTTALSRIEDATTMSSELMTAAISANATTLDLRLIVHRGWVRVEITDDGESTLRARHPSATGDFGLGLTVISALARSWAIEPADNGKLVWAEISFAETENVKCLLAAG